MWGEGSLWLLQAVFRHARRGLEQDSACGVRWLLQAVFRHARRGPCALHLAVDASDVVSGDWRRP